MLKHIKLQLIRRADWIDARILDHNFPFICNAVANSDWWGEPVNLDNLTFKQAIQEVRSPYPNYEFGEIHTYKKMRSYLPEAPWGTYARIDRSIKRLQKEWVTFWENIL